MRNLALVYRGDPLHLILKFDDALLRGPPVGFQFLRPAILLFQVLFQPRVLTQQFVPVGGGFCQPLLILFELALEELDVLLAFAQKVGSARNMNQRWNVRQRRGRAKTDEEVRIRCGTSGGANGRIGTVRDSRWSALGWENRRRIEREGLQPILKKHVHVRKYAAESCVEFAELEFVLMELIGSKLGPRLGVVQRVGRGHYE